MPKILDNPCANFEDSGVLSDETQQPLCKNCSWALNAHHLWSLRHYNGRPAWYCKKCLKTYLTKKELYNTNWPPTNIPPCIVGSSMAYLQTVDDEKAYLKARDLMNRTGATYRMIERWSSKGLLPHKFIGNPGPGSKRLYEESVVEKVKLIMRLQRVFGTNTPYDFYKKFLDSTTNSVYFDEGILVQW